MGKTMVCSSTVRKMVFSLSLSQRWWWRWFDFRQDRICTCTLIPTKWKSWVWLVFLVSMLKVILSRNLYLEWVWFFFFSFFLSWSSGVHLLTFCVFLFWVAAIFHHNTHTHTHTHTLEGELVYVVYGIEFVCFSCTTSKGTCIMDD